MSDSAPLFHENKCDKIQSVNNSDIIYKNVEEESLLYQENSNDYIEDVLLVKEYL